MLSLLLVTAMSAVADTPQAQPAPARAATRAYYPTNDSFYEPTNFGYSPPQFGFGFSGSGCGNPYFCPTDDVFLDLPCFPCAPCGITPPRPVATPRVRVYTPPPPIRYCPPRPVPCCP